MRANYKLQRLFLEENFAAGRDVEVPREATHYLINVLRMGEGARLLIFNGRDGEWLAEIAKVGKKALRLLVIEQTREQTPISDLVYCFAPIKQGRLDYLVQKAVEMGVGVLQPVLTQHTQVSRPGTDKIRANVIEAAEQCGILAIPVVHEPIKIEQLLADWDPSRILIFCDEAAESDNPLPILETLRGHKLALLIGPEGGFSDAERVALRALDYVRAIPLGPRILRADTAGVAALALIQAVLGDWGGEAARNIK